MPAYSFPTAPGEAFKDFIDKSKQLESVRLSAAIPPECFVSRTSRGLLAFALSYSLYAGAIVAVAFTPAWAWAPLWVIAGLGGWGLHCIAHDCGHNSFSRSRRLNITVGHLALLPLIYPFHAWRHVHNMHHASTNNLELDTDWSPVPPAIYERMPRWERLIYGATRTWGFWGATINYWRVSGFRPSFFPQARMRRDVRKSMAFVIPVAAVYFAALIYFTGFKGLVILFVMPWIATHAWFSVTTLMHHSDSDVPYLTSEHWTKNASRLLVTTDYIYPRWLLFLTHNISIHTAHHVAPAVPFYNLQKAQAALKSSYPGMVREKPLRFGQVVTILRRLHLYDTDSGYYQSFGGEHVPPGIPTRQGAPV